MSAVEQIYLEQSRRVFATLVRLLGDWDLAEEAMHEAFAIALVQWEVDGIPDNPRAWLVSTARFKAIDTQRRRSRHNRAVNELREMAVPHMAEIVDAPDVVDDRLRLIFTCCHPAISMEAQVALTLREVCGLTTEAIASLFLTPTSTLAQRIVRAKGKIRDAVIPYEVPGREQLPERLDAVLQVIYLVFHEGYAPSSGPELTQPVLSQEAIRLGRLVLELLPEPEVRGLLALMLLHESRRTSRVDDAGQVVLLEQQDRTRWDRGLIEEGQRLVEQALGGGRVGPYALQAAIAAVHASAISAPETDWAQIVALYGALLQQQNSPIIELNRAVAVAMRDGPTAGLQLIDQLLGQGELEDYYLAHSARADLLRRLGKNDQSAAAYRRALELVKTAPERQFLQSRIEQLTASGSVSP